MIDIHSHILPGVDDGSDSMETTLEMLYIAEQSGVTDIVATPHCNLPGLYGNYAGERLESLLGRVREEARLCEINIRIHHGMEVYQSGNFAKLSREGKIWTIAGTKYLLTEFAFDADPDECTRRLEKCKVLGYRPVVAHPERYYFVQDCPRTAFNWCTSGFALQINKGSFLGQFGEAAEITAFELTSHGLAACTASDAHGTERRNTDMRSLQRLLIREFGKEYADLLLEVNPQRILEGRSLLGYEPQPF